MTTIIKNENLQLIKEGNKYIIEFETATEANAAILRSLTRTRIIQGATLSRDYLCLKFQAQTVITLEEFLLTNKPKIAQVAIILQTLAEQLNYLIQYESKTILGFNRCHILMINNSTPAFLGLQLVADIKERESSDLATICGLFDTKDFFAAPELMKIKRLPAQVNYKVSYFSLACLIIYLLLGSDEFYTNNTNNTDYNKESILKYLDTHPIKDTKLYWLLSRCLNEEPNKRSIIFI